MLFLFLQFPGTKQTKVLLENVKAVASEDETNILEEVHISVVVGRGRKGFAKVTFGLQAVDESHPFGPGMAVVGVCAVGSDSIDRSGTSETRWGKGESNCRNWRNVGAVAED